MSKVVGSNPTTVYWMDDFHIYLLYNCNVCLKRRKTKKRPGMAHLKNAK